MIHRKQEEKTCANGHMHLISQKSCEETTTFSLVESTNIVLNYLYFLGYEMYHFY